MVDRHAVHDSDSHWFFPFQTQQKLAGRLIPNRACFGRHQFLRNAEWNDFDRFGIVVPTMIYFLEPQGRVMNSVECFQLWEREPRGEMVSEFQWQSIAQLAQLTCRELQVCKLLFAGYTRQEVADELGIKNRTSRKFAEQLHEKLQVSNRASLVLRVIQVRDRVVARKPSSQQQQQHVTICILVAK